MPDLKPGETGLVVVLFRILKATEENRTCVEEWRIRDTNRIPFGPSLYVKCFVERWENVETLCEMGIPLEEAIEALSKTNDDVSEAVNYALDNKD